MCWCVFGSVDDVETASRSYSEPTHGLPRALHCIDDVPAYEKRSTLAVRKTAATTISYLCVSRCRVARFSPTCCVVDWDRSLVKHSLYDELPSAEEVVRRFFMMTRMVDSSLLALCGEGAGRTGGGVLV